MTIHHIDSNIFLGVIKPDNQKYMKACKEYLEDAGNKYDAHISTMILGEIHKRIYIDFKREKESLSNALDFVDRLIRKEKIMVDTLRDEDMWMFSELRNIEKLSQTTDVLALAIAINRKAHVFMTADKKILESEKLKKFCKEHGLAIQMPKGIPINLRS